MNHFHCQSPQKIINYQFSIKEMNDKKELQVAALENGTVIDHIPSEKLFTVVSLLGLEHMNNNITIGFNLNSKKLGKKGNYEIEFSARTREDYYTFHVDVYDNGASNIRVNMQRKQSIDFIGDLVTEEKEPVSKKE